MHVCRVRRSLCSLPLVGASPPTRWRYRSGLRPHLAPPFGRASLATLATAQRLGGGAPLLRSLRSLRRSAPTPVLFSADAPFGRSRVAVIPPSFGFRVTLPRRVLAEPPSVGGMTGGGARSRVRLVAPDERTAKMQGQHYPNSKKTLQTLLFGSLRSPLPLYAWSNKRFLICLLSSLPTMLHS